MMIDMCSQIRSHRVSPCDHRAMTRWHIHIPRAVSWSHRVLPWVYVHATALSP